MFSSFVAGLLTREDYQGSNRLLTQFPVVGFIGVALNYNGEGKAEDQQKL